MSLESYKARMRSEGGSIQGASSKNTKRAQIEYIRRSPNRKDVTLNMDSETLFPCIPSDISTYKIRRFLFEPDNRLYKGDYIQYDNFNYLITEETTHDDYPQAIAQLCNYNFPIKIEEVKTLVGKLENGRPKYEIKKVEIIKPCVMTGKIYSSSDNSHISLPEGSMTIYLPYSQDDVLPELNFKITVKQAQYKVTDLIFENVFEFADIGQEKGYVEIRLQREANTNVK